MRKIKNKEDIQKSQRRIKIIVGIVLIGLMFLSTAGYAFFSGDSSTTHENNNSQGNYIGGKWVYNIGNEQFEFTNYIDLSKNVPVDLKISLKDYQDSPVFIVSDDDFVSREIAQNIGKYSPRIQEAC